MFRCFACRRRFAVAVLLPTLALVAAIPRARAADDEKPLPPKEVTLKTIDDVAIVATYYPSRLGKQAVPVILLHSSRGNRAEFEQLALKLQADGMALIAPDLRGHGDSVMKGSSTRGAELRAADYENMVDQDLEAVKRFLRSCNNSGELNIEKLCVVGVEMGAEVAVNWTAFDWDWPVLNTGKQGQDVKAMVLISPEWSFKGLRINEALAREDVRSDVSVLIVTGKSNSRLLAEAKRLFNSLERFHALAPGDNASEKQSLWLRTPITSLQGAKLMNEKSLHVDEMIAKFIELRLVKQQIPWSERKPPFEKQ